MITARIVTVGDEVLLGDVLDTNSNWLCKQITGLGGSVNRIAVVHDRLEDIASEIHYGINANAGLIFTVGGMGPTSDDLTLEGVAQATGRALELNAEAERLVADKYRELFENGHVDSPSMTPARRKMAMLPRGSTALPNAVGGAPGVQLVIDGTMIVSLPGVPAELRYIFENSLSDSLRKLLGSSKYSERMVLVDCKDESFLAPILREVGEDHRGVYLKSRPKRFGPDVKSRVTLSARGISSAEVEGQIGACIDALVERLAEIGVGVERVDGS